MIERELRFRLTDLQQFASASGDHNPLHTDQGFARRTPFGQCIVHGALVTLGMLGALPPEELALIRSVRARFSGPVLPDGPCRVSAEPSHRGEQAWDVRLTGRGKVLARVRVARSGDHPGRAEALEDGPVAVERRQMRGTPASPAGTELAAGHTVAGEYCPGPGLSDLARQFGAGSLDRAILEGLAWASYVVGMELPGLHSLFGGLSLEAGDAPESDGYSPRYTIRLRDHDARTGQVIMDGVLRSRQSRSAAVIEGFARTPIAPPSLEAMTSPRVHGDAGSVVVIGGTRGFGAAISLALLARGYSVHVAYSSSPDSALPLAQAGDRHGARLHLHRCDARDPDAVRSLTSAVREHDTELTGLVLNAALPPLPMGLTAESAAELATYVAESVRLAGVPLGSLLPLLKADGAWTLFCSSVAVCAPPRDWPHYVSAKAAIEGLARWVAATMPSTRTVVLRPPAMRTEWTNTPSARISAVPTEAIAAWIVGRLASDELAAGLSVLQPGADREPDDPSAGAPALARG